MELRKVTRICETAYMGSGLASLGPLSVDTVLTTGVYEEDLERAVWEAGCGIVHNADVFEKTKLNSASGFDVRGNLVYYVNSADENYPRNVQFGFRTRKGLGRELVLVTVRRVAKGEQLLATKYMKTVTRKRKRN